MTNSKFDIDLERGRVNEKFAQMLFTGNLTVEVKTDFIVSASGCVAIEYHCRGKKSGISATEADWWIIFLDGEGYRSQVAVIIETSRLKKLCMNPNYRTVWGGDDMAAAMVLVPKADLLGLAK